VIEKTDIINVTVDQNHSYVNTEYSSFLGFETVIVVNTLLQDVTMYNSANAYLCVRGNIWHHISEESANLTSMGSTGVMTDAVIVRAAFFVGELLPSSVLLTAFDRTASKSRDV
jgi:hypothetical protein